MHDTIVDDLVSRTVTYRYDGKSASVMTQDRLLGTSECITPEMITQLPKNEQPQLTGGLMTDVMNKRFAEMRSIDDVHDAVTYKANQERLCDRYAANKDSVASHIRDILPSLDLTGQWSIDVMQNGDDFYLIDMAMAENSAFCKDVVAPELRRPTQEDWIPRLPE
jgi:hypothetical protein